MIFKIIKKCHNNKKCSVVLIINDHPSYSYKLIIKDFSFFISLNAIVKQYLRVLDHQSPVYLIA